jgi:hypothetical protein
MPKVWDLVVGARLGDARVERVRPVDALAVRGSA